MTYEQELILAGFVGGMSVGLLCIAIQGFLVERRMARVLDYARALAPRPVNTWRLALWCQEKIDAAERGRDLRWVRRIVK